MNKRPFSVALLLVSVLLAGPAMAELGVLVTKRGQFVPGDVTKTDDGYTVELGGETKTFEDKDVREFIRERDANDALRDARKKANLREPSHLYELARYALKHGLAEESLDFSSRLLALNEKDRTALQLKEAALELNIKLNITRKRLDEERAAEKAQKKAEQEARKAAREAAKEAKRLEKEAQKASTQPATQPAVAEGETVDPELAARRAKRLEERREKLFAFLEREYAQRLESPDWVTRSIIAVSLSRVPTESSTERLLTMAESDPHDMPRLMAWQGILSRSRTLSEEQFQRWVVSTGPLVQRDAFKGDMRVGLVRLMTVAKPNQQLRDLWWYIFEHTNSRDPADMHTINALADCLREWRSPSLVEKLIGRLTTLNDAFRAQHILLELGSPIPAANAQRSLGSEAMWKSTQDWYVRWWNSERDKWQEKDTYDPGHYKTLEGYALPDLPEIAEINLDELERDLELRMLRMKSFDIVFVVDATGSMGEVLKWLRRDVKQMLDVFHLIAREPRIGITFYRDDGDDFVTQHVKLTSDIDELQNALKKMDAKGGGDIPEAVYRGLRGAIAEQPWVSSGQGRRIIVLLGDAPPHESTMDELLPMVKQANEQGFQFFAYNVETRHGGKFGEKGENWREVTSEAFGKIAEAGGGLFRQLKLPRGGSHAHSGVANPRSDTPAGEVVLAEVLAHTISPQFVDRIQPFVRVAVAYCQEVIPETRSPRDKWVPRPPSKRKPYKPKDPQAQD